MLCFFVSDFHGRTELYTRLFEKILLEKPDAVFMGGDLLASGMFAFASSGSEHRDFINDFLATGLSDLKNKLGDEYPEIFLILGNDDGRSQEDAFIELAEQGFWKYAHNKKLRLGEFSVYGYSFVPPTPFQLKDWERYDVSRYIEPGTISPEEGLYTYPASDREKKFATIAKDLDALTLGEENFDKTIFLFHTPPYQTNLDRAARDGEMIDYAPLDVNVGSVAVRRLIEKKQPLLTLHGHVHESSRLTGSWQDKIGRTVCLTAAYDGPRLALIKFDPHFPEKAVRQLF